LRRAPREPSTEQRRGRLVRTLDDDRIGPQLPQLPPDAKGERGPEQRTVETPRPEGRDEPEDAVGRRRAARRAADHAQLELPAERAELPRQALAQRQAIARPARHEQ